MRKILALTVLIVFIIGAGLGYSLSRYQENQSTSDTISSPLPTIEPEERDSALSHLLSKNDLVSPTPIPPQKTLQNDYHVFQTFNNCGPASLSMALSYNGINVSQAELGRQLRPYQVASGNNDDKSVTLAEIAKKAEEFGLKSYHRPGGSVNLIEQFIANDIPIIARTWLSRDESIGHYRVIKGYDRELDRLLQDDSLQGKNLWYNYDDFDEIWKKFNYEYVVIVPPEKISQIEQILDDGLDETRSWHRAIVEAEDLLNKNPDDVYARFNLSVALYKVGDYKRSVVEFEMVEHKLPFRTLWYQIEPILSYFELRDYDRVLQITEKIINNHNRAFSELYILRGDVFKNRGDLESAKKEYELAVKYNSELELARERLGGIQDSPG